MPEPKRNPGTPRTPEIVVVGSLVMDLVFRARARPGPGETLLGEEFGVYLGGKGFNQALACHRLGANVTLVGRVGKDLFGDMFLAKLAEEGMDTTYVSFDEREGTGVASPVVFPDGENSIIGIPRANLRLGPDDVERAAAKVADADMLMLQFEVNPAASEAAARLARERDTVVMLDPAPVHRACDSEDWPVDYLVPNEVEASMLAKRSDVSGDDTGYSAFLAQSLARDLYNDRLRALVLSSGRAGAVAADAAGVRRIPGYSVRTIDSTGAGDAFRAGLAVMLADGCDIDDAVRFANACGALACTVKGAEPSMPGRDAVETFLSTRRGDNEHSD